MRIFLAAVMIAALTAPTFAQDTTGGGKRRHAGGHNPNAQTQEQKKKKAEDQERAAKAAIEKLPDQPFDPWRNVR